MAIKHGNQYYALVDIRENGRLWRRRVNSCELQGESGQVCYAEGKDIPFTHIILDTGTLNCKKGGTLQILNIPSRRSFPDYAPGWPVGRFVVISLCITGMLHALATFASTIS